MTVEARDGFIGTVDELVIDKSSGRVTHFVLKKDHLWGEADITLASLNGQPVRLPLTDDLVSQLASASNAMAEDEPKNL